MGLAVLVTILEAQKLIAQRLPAISEILVLSTALTAESDAFKLGEDSLQTQIEDLKVALSS